MMLYFKLLTVCVSLMTDDRRVYPNRVGISLSFKSWFGRKVVMLIIVVDYPRIPNTHTPTPSNFQPILIKWLMGDTKSAELSAARSENVMSQLQTPTHPNNKQQARLVAVL